MNKIWRQILKENWFKEAAEGRAEVLDFNALNKLFNAFHVSEKLLNNTKFTFTPRLPRAPYVDQTSNVIEDDFTPRVSIGPTVQKCLEALDTGEGYIYAADFKLIHEDDVELHNLGQKFFPKCVKDLSTPDNKYGKGFYLSSFLNKLTPKRSILDPDPEWPDEETKQKYMKGCVPDAKDTKERWSTEPITMYFIGRIVTEFDDHNGEVLLSPSAHRLFRYVGEKYSAQYGKLFSRLHLI